MPKKTTIKNSSKRHKISVISAISLVIGSTIGAGLFIKNKEILDNTAGNWILVLLCWAVSAIGIIALSLTLFEICSGDKVKDSGVVSWVETFNSKFTYIACRNFMSYIYLPTNFFIMPLFAVQQFCLAINWEASWYVIGIISLVLTLWFTIASGASVKITNIQNWIITSVKFIPIVFAAIIGYIFLGTGGVTPQHDSTSLDPFIKLSPIIGVLMSIPSIIFVFDGFYACTGLQTSMKQPKKMPMAMVTGLIIVVSISVLISISLLISTRNGSLDDFGNSGSIVPRWLYSTIEVMIAIGILGILNGLAMFGAKYYEQLISTDEVLFSTFIKLKCKKYIGVVYSLILYVVVFIICFAIGLVFIKTSDGNIPGTDPFNDKLFSLANITGNWTSLLIFGAIAISAIGCLKNRKTNKISVQKTKLFVPSAYISSIIISVAVIISFVGVIADIIIMTTDSGYEFYDKTGEKPCILGSLMSLIFAMLIFTVIYCEPIKKKILKQI